MPFDIDEEDIRTITKQKLRQHFESEIVSKVLTKKIKEGGNAMINDIMAPLSIWLP